MNNKMGERIKVRREQLGMSQSELAKRTNCSDKSHISRIEHGMKNIPSSKILIFAEALQCDANYLMGIYSGELQAPKVRVKSEVSELSADETMLMDLYRKLTKKEKSAVVEIIRTILNTIGGKDGK